MSKLRDLTAQIWNEALGGEYKPHEVALELMRLIVSISASTEQPRTFFKHFIKELEDVECSNKIEEARDRITQALGNCEAQQDSECDGYACTILDPTWNVNLKQTND